MIIAIHQPDYIPYIGYFYKIAQADIFVFLDDVQFSNDNMHHWNRIKTSQGECRLKIPVSYNFGDPINQVKTKDELKWKSKHLKTIEMNYIRTPYFKEIFSKFQELLLANYTDLADMNITINSFICDKFGIKKKFIKASDLQVLSVREQRVIDICQILNGTTYISGHGARNYQVEEHFTDKSIRLLYTDYQPISHPQLWSTFLPNMSIMDFVFNCGFNWEFIVDEIRRLKEVADSNENRNFSQ